MPSRPEHRMLNHYPVTTFSAGMRLLLRLAQDCMQYRPNQLCWQPGAHAVRFLAGVHSVTKGRPKEGQRLLLNQHK